jgi:hypothetical protein
MHSSLDCPVKRAEEVLLLDQNQSVRSFGGYDRPILVTLDNFTPIARPSSRRRIFQMSALSTVDGRLRAYHGCNG